MGIRQGRDNIAMGYVSRLAKDALWAGGAIFGSVVALMAGGVPLRQVLLPIVILTTATGVLSFVALLAVQIALRAEICGRADFHGCIAALVLLWSCVLACVVGVLVSEKHRLTFLWAGIVLLTLISVHSLLRLGVVDRRWRFVGVPISSPVLLAAAVIGLTCSSIVGAIPPTLGGVEDRDQGEVSEVDEGLVPQTTVVISAEEVDDPPPLSSVATLPTTTVPVPVDCGPEPWVDVEAEPGALSDAVAESIMARLAEVPFVLGGCPAAVEARADVGLTLVFTECRIEWDECSPKMLVGHPGGAVTLVHERDIDGILEVLGDGRLSTVSERRFDGHTWWYDLEAAGITGCSSYVGSFDGAFVLLPPEAQFLWKELMIRSETVLEPVLVELDGAQTDELRPNAAGLPWTVTFRPSKPTPADGYVSIAVLDGQARVYASTLKEFVGLSVVAPSACRVSSLLDSLAPSASGRSTLDVSNDPRLVGG